MRDKLGWANKRRKNHIIHHTLFCAILPFFPFPTTYICDPHDFDNILILITVYLKCNVSMKYLLLVQLTIGKSRTCMAYTEHEIIDHEVM